MMLIEIHHLESVELIGDSLNLLCFTLLNRFHTFCIPDIRSAFAQLVVCGRPSLPADVCLGIICSLCCRSMICLTVDCHF